MAAMVEVDRRRNLDAADASARFGDPEDRPAWPRADDYPITDNPHQGAEVGLHDGSTPLHGFMDDSDTGSSQDLAYTDNPISDRRVGGDLRRGDRQSDLEARADAERLRELAADREYFDQERELERERWALEDRLRDEERFRFGDESRGDDGFS